MVKAYFMTNVLSGDNTMNKAELQGLIERFTHCKAGECCQLINQMEAAGVLKLSTSPTPHLSGMVYGSPMAFSTRQQTQATRTPVLF
jgi:hypothetical protein